MVIDKLNRRIHQIQQSQSQNTNVSSIGRIIGTGTEILPATPITSDSEPLSSPIQFSPTSDTFPDDAFLVSLDDYVSNSELRHDTGVDAEMGASYDGTTWMLEAWNDEVGTETWPLNTATASSSIECTVNPATLSGDETLELAATDPDLSLHLHNSSAIAIPGITGDIWPASIHEGGLLPWIDIYFNRLHPTVPVLDRSLLYKNILAQEHRRNPNFGALLLALCAFALTQPVQIDERPSNSTRTLQAKSYLTEAVKMRSCSDFGENPTLEAILTSFFLFACLFGSNQHNAAWHRLR